MMLRILYKRESPYFDFQACFHETGHAMHASLHSKPNLSLASLSRACKFVPTHSLLMHIYSRIK